jgi:hypothetical protein
LILDGLKKRLYDENCKKGGKWIDEISSVIWELRTQPSKATGSSPFFLVYGSKTVLPADVMWKSPRPEMFEEGKADTARHLKLDSATEIRCNVLLQSARYVQGVRRYHDQNVQRCPFDVGDMFFNESRMTPGYTSLTRDGRGLSSCIRLQNLGRIAYRTPMARRFLIPRISSTCAVFILSQPRHLLSASGDLYFQYNSVLQVYDR